MSIRKDSQTNSEEENIFILTHTEAEKFQRYGFIIKNIISREELLARVIFMIWIIINGVPLA